MGEFKIYPTELMAMTLIAAGRPIFISLETLSLLNLNLALKKYLIFLELKICKESTGMLELVLIIVGIYTICCTQLIFEKTLFSKNDVF
jgi:hypothetical protein